MENPSKEQEVYENLGEILHEVQTLAEKIPNTETEIPNLLQKAEEFIALFKFSWDDKGYLYLRRDRLGYLDEQFSPAARYKIEQQKTIVQALLERGEIVHAQSQAMVLVNQILRYGDWIMTKSSMHDYGFPIQEIRNLFGIEIATFVFLLREKGKDNMPKRVGGTDMNYTADAAVYAAEIVFYLSIPMMLATVEGRLQYLRDVSWGAIVQEIEHSYTTEYIDFCKKRLGSFLSGVVTPSSEENRVLLAELEFMTLKEEGPVSGRNVIKRAFALFYPGVQGIISDEMLDFLYIDITTARGYKPETYWPGIGERIKSYGKYDM